MDMVPGLITYLWFTPTKMGTYEIICAEFCGNGHSDMRGSVVVGDESEFQAWLSDQPTFADYLAEAG
jgi:cytochrome c oxidase subunit 2